jgi:hypothetical protein
LPWLPTGNLGCPEKIKVAQKKLQILQAVRYDATSAISMISKQQIHMFKIILVSITFSQRQTLCRKFSCIDQDSNTSHGRYWIDESPCSLCALRHQAFVIGQINMNTPRHARSPCMATKARTFIVYVPVSISLEIGYGAATVITVHELRCSLAGFSMPAAWAGCVRLELNILLIALAVGHIMILTSNLVIFLNSFPFYLFKNPLAHWQPAMRLV